MKKRKTKRPVKLDRWVAMSEANLIAAVDTYMTSMRLIDLDEKVLEVSNWDDQKNEIHILIGKEVNI